MAWVTEYDMTWRSMGDNGLVLLQRDGGTYQSALPLKSNSLEISDHLSDWESHIVRKRASFTIVNNFSDFYELMPLMTISAGQIRVVITQYYSGLGHIAKFIGFLNCETINQNMLNNSEIRFTASGLLSKLEYLESSVIDTSQIVSLIDIIDSCLTLTGFSDQIYVNCSLYEENATLGTGDSLFNLTGLFTELFWENNVERVSALEVLEKILQSTNCYLYWHRETWYIEHYEDLGKTTKNYVYYNSGVSYDYDNPGNAVSPITPTIHNVHDRTLREQVNASQMLSVIPGMREIEIKTNQKQYFNIFNGDLTNLLETTDTRPTVYPALRTWSGWNQDTVYWSHEGDPFLNITNSVKRTNYDIVGPNWQYNGLTTRFQLTVNTTTELTITFKIAVIQNRPTSDVWDNPEDYVLYLNWYLATSEEDYIWYSAALGWQWTNNPLSVTGTLEEIEVTEFDFRDTGATLEVTLTIPIGEVVTASPERDYDISFRCGNERWINKDTLLGTPSDEIYFGDFNCVASEPGYNNLLQGEITSDFLDKKSISLDVFDGSFGFANTLFYYGTSDWATYGTGWLNRTQSWDYDGSDYTSLMRKILQSKFRLYRIARQRMTIEYINTPGQDITEFIPMCMFYDNKQSNKKFIMLSNTWNLERAIQKIVLWEYDDTETINLI